MLKQKISKRLSIMALLALLPWQAFAQIDPAFNPNNLVDDKIFADTETFGGAEGVQKFLEVKGSVLANTSSDFVQKLKEPSISMLKQGLEDPQPNLNRLRTAAELVWDASKQSGLNPQVIIVTLQKEQGLITNHQNDTPSQLQKVLDKAMGFACPDEGGCGDLFPGFYYQLFGNFDAAGNRYLGAAKSLMKSYNYTQGRGPLVNGSVSHVGDTITLDNTPSQEYNPPASQLVTLLNRATAALYRYTPHVFNGNYNFWKFFQAWFRYPNGTLLSLANDVKTYIIQNGTKQLVPNFVAVARNLNLTGKITISPTEFESYPTDVVYGPADNTIVKVPEENKTYVFLNNIKHPASDFVIKQRGLNAAVALTVSSTEASLFEQGNVLTPNDGTVIRGKEGPAVYLVQNGRLQLFSNFTFSQRKITAKQITLVPDEEVATYEKQGIVAPLDGTLIKAQDSTTVYLIDQGLKRPLTAELFKNRGFSFKNVKEITTEEVAALPIGAYTTPKERTYFADVKGGNLYIFKDGAKHAISNFVAKQRGITPDYFFGSSVAYEWLDGIPIPPRDGTLIKGNASKAVYLVSKSQLRPLTAKAFATRRYSAKKIVTLPQAEVDAYAKGDVITK